MVECPEEDKILTSNLQVLIKCNEALLEELLRKDKPPIATVALAFVKVGPFLRLYGEYCRNYVPALAVVKRLESHPGCVAFLEAASKQTGGLTFQSYMTKPVQRLAKYHLLLKELVTVAEKAGDLALAELRRALDLV